MTRPSTPLDDCVVHSGVLFKRGYGKILGRKAWKPRHFELTRTKLRHYKFENGKLRREIDLMQCSEAMLEIMPADARKTGRSASSIWRLALNVPRRPRLLIAAPTEREMNEWIKHLSHVLRQIDTAKTTRRGEANPGMLDVEDWERFVPAGSRRRFFDRQAAPTLEKAKTDFQNFVAQPRRSVISRRQSLDSRPITMGTHRHSTGQIDDKQLQRELEELRSGNDNFDGEEEQKNDDDEEEKEEEALLRATREFSVAHGDENKNIFLGVDIEESKEDDEDVPILDADNSSPPVTLVQPIFQYKKEEPPSDEAISISTTGSLSSEDERTWFSRFSGKFHRKTRKTIDMRDTRVEELPHHYREDPAVAKPRRFSTGSMLLNSESRVPTEHPSDEDREEALIQELLTGLAPNAGKGEILSSIDVTRTMSSTPSPRHTTLSAAITDHSIGPSEARKTNTASSQVSPSNDAGCTPRQCEDVNGAQEKKTKWFRRLTGKWRSDRELNEGDGPAPTLIVQDTSGSAVTEAFTERDRPGYFRRLSNKFHDSRGKQSRRHSTGGVLPEVCDFISEEQPTDELQFAANCRRSEVNSGRFVGCSKPTRVCAA